MAEACSSNPTRSYLISPPMYRVRPLWYREGLPEIMNLFSQVLSQDRPPNLFLLPSFPTPDFEADGVHLTAYSGLEFILHLFDCSIERLESAELPPAEQAAIGSESTRVLEDRVMALEQDHRRLNKAVESKVAVDAELADFHLNERNEDFFVIESLERISDELVGKAWQTQAVKDVQAAIRLLMGREMPIVFVKNATGRHKGAPVTYNVQMSTVQDAGAIRKRFGSHFLSGRDERPKEIRHFSVKNLITPETKIRISILKLLAQRYRDSNPGSKVKVVGYQPRPLIKITPAPSSSDRRIQIYNYVQAVKTLPCSFSAGELEPIMRRINPKLVGQIRSTFIILSDDSFKKWTASSRPTTEPSTSSVSAVTEATTDGVTEDPEPMAVSESRSRTSSRSSQSRGSKRGASPSAAAPAKR